RRVLFRSHLGPLDGGELTQRSGGRLEIAVAGEPDLVDAAEHPDEVVTRALGLDAPGVDDRDPVAETFGLLHVVRGVEDGHPFDREGLDGFEDGVAGLRVHPDGRLVDRESTRLY